jgi:hypothetical protein
LFDAFSLREPVSTSLENALQRRAAMSLQQQSVDARPRPRWLEIGADRWLSLAAAPTFAIMALLSATGAPDVLCSSAGASPLAGMMTMYLLMSAFHSAPWLRLIAKAWRHS